MLLKLKKCYYRKCNYRKCGFSKCNYIKCDYTGSAIIESVTLVSAIT